MSRKIDIELTSGRADGTWTWRVAGAKQPKGILDGALLPAGSKVGDVLRAEAEFELEGTMITSVVPPPGKRPEPERLELLTDARPFEGVTTSLVAKSGRPRRERDDGGPRPDRPSRPDRPFGSDRASRPDRTSGPDRASGLPRADGPAGRPGSRSSDAPRSRPERGPRPPRSEPIDGSRRDERRDGARTDGARAESGRADSPRPDGPPRPPGRRPDNRRTDAGRPRSENRADQGGRHEGDDERHDRTPAGAPRAKRLSPANTHRNVVLDSLAPEERAVAEQLLHGGIPAVRRAVQEQNARAKEEGRPEVKAEALLGLAEELLPRLKGAEWRDRADAATKDADEIALRDLRSVVAGADAGARDDESRILAKTLREALDRREVAAREAWAAEITTCLDEGRVTRALRVAGRPPDPRTRFPTELITRLTESASAAMGPDTPPDRWAALLSAVLESPVRRSVKPTGLPTAAGDALLAAARQASGRIPALAAMLGLQMPPPPGPPRPGARPPRPLSAPPVRRFGPGAGVRAPAPEPPREAPAVAGAAISDDAAASVRSIEPQAPAEEPGLVVDRGPDAPDNPAVEGFAAPTAPGVAVPALEPTAVETAVVEDLQPEAPPVLADGPPVEPPVLADGPPVEPPVLADGPPVESPVLADGPPAEPPVAVWPPAARTVAASTFEESPVEVSPVEVSPVEVSPVVLPSPAAPTAHAPSGNAPEADVPSLPAAPVPPTRESVPTPETSTPAAPPDAAAGTIGDTDETAAVDPSPSAQTVAAPLAADANGASISASPVEPLRPESTASEPHEG